MYAKYRISERSKLFQNSFWQALRFALAAFSA